MASSMTLMHDKSIKTVTSKQKVLGVFGTILCYIFLILVAIAVLFPFYWMINSSLKTIEEYRLSVPTFWPKQVMWSNYAAAFQVGNLGTLFKNTVIVGVVSTILSLIVTILSAFAFARLEFKGKNL